jgi:hypothetical protein
VNFTAIIGDFILSLRESDLILSSVPCTSGMEPFCILDPEHPCCENIKRETIKFKNGILVKQGNSAIVSLALTFNDAVEEFIFDRIRNELHRQSGSQVKVIRNPEEGYQISFFLNTEMVKSEDQRKQLIAYWADFAINLRQALTDGKMVINKFVRNRAESLRLK